MHVSYTLRGEAMPSSCVWHSARPRNLFLETTMVAPRKGAMKKLLRRLKMSPEQRTRDIAAAPDRIVMRDHIFPEVARRGGDILFVGVRAYTAEYPDQFEEFGGTCWTIDRDRAAIAYGVAGRHVTGCVTRVDSLFSTCRFRTIVLTGVLGFGVNRFSDQIKTIAACAAILEPEGTLVLGWNDRRVHSSLFEEAASRWFDFRNFGTLPPRIWVRGYDHNFAFLRRRASDA